MFKIAAIINHNTCGNKIYPIVFFILYPSKKFLIVNIFAINIVIIQSSNLLK